MSKVVIDMLFDVLVVSVLCYLLFLSAALNWRLDSLEKIVNTPILCTAEWNSVKYRGIDFTCAFQREG